MITRLHIKSGDDSLNGIAVIGQTKLAVAAKFLKINTSQAIGTLYVYNTFGEDIYVSFSLNDRTR